MPLILSGKKKSICRSIFEFDASNHALVYVQILFKIVPLILAHGSTLKRGSLYVHYLEPFVYLLGFYYVFIHTLYFTFHMILWSLFVYLGVYGEILYINRWDLVDRPLLRWDHWKTPSILEITGSITGLYTSNVYSIGTVGETEEGVRVVAYVHNSKDKRKEREVSRE